MSKDVVDPVASAEVEEPPVAAPVADAAPTKSGAASRPAWLRFGGLIVAVLVMASGLFAWWHTAHDDSIELAQTRDAVLISARQDIEIMNSLDYRSVDKGLKNWQSVTTGTLHDQIASVDADDIKLLADQKKISTGKVVDAAVVDLDETSATVIASIEVTVKDDADKSAKPTVKRNRFSADLKMVGGHWKLETLQQVAVNVS